MRVVAVLSFCVARCAWCELAQVVQAQGSYSTVRIGSSRGHVKECNFFVFSMFYVRKLNMRVNRIDHVMEINKVFPF